MPAKSKAQQRFMGLVHAFNKGDVKGSEVSKKVKDVAKDMKKSDVKKYASTKHKGKPEKVKQEDINLETLIKENPAAIAAAVQAMQKMQAKNPKTGRVNKLSTALSNKEHPSHKKAKGVFSKIVDKFKKKKKEEPKKQSKADVDFYKKQFTGEVFDKLREMIRIELEGCGYTTSAVDPNIKLKSPGGTGEEDEELKEGKQCLCEKCWKGYKIHPTRKTKVLFGKRYPNCIKNESAETMKFKRLPKIYKNLKDAQSAVHKQSMKNLRKSTITKNMVVLKSSKGGFQVAIQESITEDGHTDVASAKRSMKLVAEDAQEVLQMLTMLNDEDSLPSWWMNKIAVVRNDINKARDYLKNPNQ